MLFPADQPVEQRKCQSAAPFVVAGARTVCQDLAANVRHAPYGADADDPWAITARLLDAVPPGSYLVVSHPTADIQTTQVSDFQQRYNQSSADQATFRSRGDVARFFAGLDLLEPGVVRIPDWRPASAAEAASPANMWGGVGRKG